MGENNWDKSQRQQPNMVVHVYASEKEDAYQQREIPESNNQRANITQTSGSSNTTQTSQHHARVEPNNHSKHGNRGQNYFTDEQYNQIMHMLDKGKEVGMTRSMDDNATNNSSPMQMCEPSWIIDSRATDHMTNYLKLLNNLNTL